MMDTLHDDTPVICRYAGMRPAQFSLALISHPGSQTKPRTGKLLGFHEEAWDFGPNSY